MENKDSQSRASETQIVVLQKDIEHLQYVIKELEEQCEFVKAHFTTKNGERLDDIKLISSITCSIVKARSFPLFLPDVQKVHV